MLKVFIKEVLNKGFFLLGPELLFASHGSPSTQVERRAIRESAFGAGARRVS